MRNARIDITQGVDGEPLVLACFDLDDADIAASAYAVTDSSRARFRTASMSTDDVLEMRELTALADELAELARLPGIRTVVMRPARLAAYRHALEHFVESRDEAEWIRDEEREPLARMRGLLAPLQELSADAMRAALSPPSKRPS